jgi:hypothetical protein
MISSDPSRERVEKLMSLSLLEFQTTLGPLIGRPLNPTETSTVHPLGSASVMIAYTPQPSVTFGGLLHMPRALVSLTFSNATQEDRRVFLSKFDNQFRRGGG